MIIKLIMKMSIDIEVRIILYFELFFFILCFKSCLKMVRFYFIFNKVVLLIIYVNNEILGMCIV